MIYLCYLGTQMNHVHLLNIEISAKQQNLHPNMLRKLVKADLHLSQLNRTISVGAKLETERFTLPKCGAYCGAATCV
jgi:hypothetical protein